MSDMPHYLLSVCYPADAVRPDDDRIAKIMTNVAALNADMMQAGVWVFAGGLADPSTATVVTDDNGDVVVHDGPFIESKEQVGGLTVIEATDLDAAMHWATRMAQAITVPIEVRPFEHAFTA
jgi:hypothetical protein